MVGPRDVAYSDSDAFYVGWTVGLYWVPFAMQYTSYSVFCLFLGKVVYREHWKRHRWKRMFISGFSLTNFLMFVFILVWATRSALIVIGHNEPPRKPARRSGAGDTVPVGVGFGAGADWRRRRALPVDPVAPATYYISEVLDRQLHYVMGTAFAVLSVFFGLLSVRYMGIDRKVLRRMLVFHPRRLGALTMVMSFVFVTRAALSTFTTRSPCPRVPARRGSRCTSDRATTSRSGPSRCSRMGDHPDDAHLADDRHPARRRRPLDEQRETRTARSVKSP